MNKLIILVGLVVLIQLCTAGKLRIIYFWGVYFGEKRRNSVLLLKQYFMEVLIKFWR